jgi:glyoxylase-like metal-dependent hydrolase (beta-lactamase superfamily II)
MRKPLFALTLLLFPLLTHAQTRTLDIYWVDVEGGAATLIVTPAGESILIDSGNPGGRDADRIYKAAQAAGLKRIDYLVTTHFHIDHYGGAAELSRKIPIGTSTTKEFRRCFRKTRSLPNAFRSTKILRQNG